MYLQILKKFVENVELLFLLLVKFVVAFVSYSCRVGGQHCFVNKIPGRRVASFHFVPGHWLCWCIKSARCHFLLKRSLSSNPLNNDSLCEFVII